MEFLSTEFSRRQSSFLQLSRLNELVQQYICLADDRLIGLATCNELTLVETGTIVKQEFYVP